MDNFTTITPDPENDLEPVAVATTSDIVTAAKAKAMTAVDMAAFKRVEKLYTARQSWEETVYKTSNDMLYGILADCYRLYHDMCGKSAMAEALRRALANKLADRQIKVKEGTHTMTKIVRCVFDGDRRRISAYSLALRAAYYAKPPVRADDFVEFIRKNHGVEEIRLQRKTNALTPDKKAEAASKALADTALTSVNAEDIVKSLDAANVGAKVVLIATQQADGTLHINAVVQSKTVVTAALAAFYGANKSTIEAHAANTAQGDAEAEERRLMDALVEEAANAA